MEGFCMKNNSRFMALLLAALLLTANFDATVFAGALDETVLEDDDSSNSYADENDEDEEEEEEEEEEPPQPPSFAGQLPPTSYTSSTIDISSIVFDEIFTGDETITAAKTISNKTVLYEGDLTIAAGVTLNAGSLVVVLGTLNTDSGHLTLNNSEMHVFGDFRIQARDGNGGYGATGGYAKLRDGARLAVYGDFYTQSSIVHWFGDSSSPRRPASWSCTGTSTRSGQTRTTCTATKTPSRPSSRGAGSNISPSTGTTATPRWGG
jgi:hypothetical protein